jgi:hypothetical protein
VVQGSKQKWMRLVREGGTRMRGRRAVAGRVGVGVPVPRPPAWSPAATCACCNQQWSGSGGRQSGINGSIGGTTGNAHGMHMRHVRRGGGRRGGGRRGGGRRGEGRRGEEGGGGRGGREGGRKEGGRKDIREPCTCPIPLLPVMLEHLLLPFCCCCCCCCCCLQAHPTTIDHYPLMAHTSVGKKRTQPGALGFCTAGE